jgi:hypothetical protein
VPRQSRQRCAHALQSYFAVTHADCARAQTEPSVVLLHAEGLERDDGEAGLLEEEAADGFVCAETIDEIELHREIRSGPAVRWRDRHSFSTMANSPS